MTGNATVGQRSIEARVVDLISGAEVPAVAAIPGEWELEQPAVLLGEVRACDFTAPRHVVDTSLELVEASPSRARQVLDLVEPAVALDDLVMKASGRMLDRGIERGLDAHVRRPAMKRAGHRVLAIRRGFRSVARRTRGVADIRGGAVDVAERRRWFVG